jgi:hypothetical protein
MMTAHYYRIKEDLLNKIKFSRELQESLIYEQDCHSANDSYLCINEFWHAISFLLGHAELIEDRSREMAIFGNPLNEDERFWFTFGPLRYFTPIDIQNICNLFSQITSKELISNFNVALMAEHEIHPDNWWIVDEEESAEKIKFNYESLSLFSRKRCRTIIILLLT